MNARLGSCAFSIDSINLCKVDYVSDYLTNLVNTVILRLVRLHGFDQNVRSMRC